MAFNKVYYLYYTLIIKHVHCTRIYIQMLISRKYVKMCTREVRSSNTNIKCISLSYKMVDIYNMLYSLHST